MTRWIAVLLCLVPSALAAQIQTPERPRTEPKAVGSPVNSSARPVPIEDIVFSRSVGSAAWSRDGRQVFLTTNLTGRMNIWRVDAAGGWPVQLTQGDSTQSGLAVSADGKTLYFQQDQGGGSEQYDIFAVPAAGGPATNLTNTPDRREYALLPSPDGRTAAISVRANDAPQVNLATLDLASGRIRSITDEADPQYRWYPVAWTQGGRALIASRGNANQTVTEIHRIDIASGKRTVLIAAPDTVYQPADATSDGRFIALTSNHGSPQLRAGVYDVATGEIKWLEDRPWEQQAVEIAPDDRTLVIRTIEDGRAELSLVHLGTMRERPLAIPPGQIQLIASDSFTPNGDRFLVSRSGADSPTELYIVDRPTGRIEQLTALAMAALDAANLPRSEIVTYQSFDGTLVSAIVTMPYNLDRNGRNPAVVIVHGGPTQQALDGFSSTATALASRGFVVIQPNFRGSTGYGTSFQTANFQDLGGGDLKDVLAAKRFLVDTGYVDPDRVGIMGGSYGGFMTLMALGKAPKEFAAGVQLYGIINWRTMIETASPLLRQYVISLLGDPEEHGAVYDAASPMAYVPSIEAPLLTLQGANDVRVPQGQAKEVEAALKATGTKSEVIFYPEEGHGFQKRDNQLDSLRRTVEWFETYLM